MRSRLTIAMTLLMSTFLLGTDGNCNPNDGSLVPGTREIILRNSDHLNRAVHMFGLNESRGDGNLVEAGATRTIQVSTNATTLGIVMLFQNQGNEEPSASVTCNLTENGTQLNIEFVWTGTALECREV